MAKNTYDDKFVDVMQYAELQLSEEHQKRRIRNDGDLRKLFEELDRKRQGGDKRMSEGFITKLVQSTNGRNAIGKVLPTGEYINQAKNTSAARMFRMNTKMEGGISQWRTFTYGGGSTQEPPTVPQRQPAFFEAKAQYYRDQGKDVYPYTRKDGMESAAVKARVKGKGVPRFRDVVTGRFTPKGAIRE